MNHRANLLCGCVLLLDLLSASPAFGAGACCVDDDQVCRQVNTAAMCGQLGGIFFDGATCAQGVCDPGACCFGANCTTQSAYACISGGRDFLGGGTSCAGNPCAPPVGACCTGGSCSETTQSACAGGTWQGAGSSCAAGCATGSCCLSNGCQVSTGAGCTAAGGVFVGGSDCVQDCAAGACCHAFTCTVEDAYACVSGGGVFQGAMSDCAGQPCGSPPQGGCCLDGVCSTQTQADCAASGGAWLGSGSGCAAGSCSAGACCLPEGGCTQVLPYECGASGGVFIAGADCAANACGVGACCDGMSCSAGDAYTCIFNGRQFGGAGTTCVDDPCEAGVGACCNNGTCTDDSPEGCAAGGGTWLGAGTTCVQGHCALGACCTPGACAVVERRFCAAQDATFVEGADCVTGEPCDLPNDCDADSLYAQSPGFGGAGMADTGHSAVRYDNYSGALGAIEAVTFWGLDLEFTPAGFVECVETDPLFDIYFFEDYNGAPAGVVCGYSIVASRTPTGMFAQDFAEYNEYHVVLPDPCILTDGWIQILGRGGDPACWFLWVSSPDGDGAAHCTGCGFPPDNDYDLSFCLEGSLGGVFGACCDESSGTCGDGVEITDCYGTGIRFHADALCADVAPCVVTPGACCYTDGRSCQVSTEVTCVSTGGNWQEAFSDCSVCPPAGACCVQDGVCVVATQADCTVEHGTWIGLDTTCDDCPPIPPDCPGGTLVDDKSDPPLGFIATTSEISPGFAVFDPYTGAAGEIDGLSWFGLDLHYVGGGTFVECAEFDNTFDISFHEDAGGVPGPAVCTYSLFVTRTATGIQYRTAELNQYSVTLPEPCVLVNGWVSIVGRGDPECWFLWMSGEGDQAWCNICGTEFIESRNICLLGETGGVSGACCDEGDAVCTEDAEITACVDLDQRFLEDGACADFAPVCGIVPGACCFADATCSVLEQDACATAGGSWLGGHSLCAQCPCITPCPPGGLMENEPVCGPGYVDVTNGGCFADAQAYMPIAPDTTVCGQSGVWVEGGFRPDYDWYEAVVDVSSDLTWTVVAEYPVRATIYNGGNGCPAAAIASRVELECDAATATATVGPGRYWLVTHPVSATDLAQCGARYTAVLTAVEHEFGDFDDDGDVDLDDHFSFAICMQGPNAPPGPPIAECRADFDFDVDGDVDEEDFAGFQRAFSIVP